MRHIIFTFVRYVNSAHSIQRIEKMERMKAKIYLCIQNFCEIRSQFFEYGSGK